MPTAAELRRAQVAARARYQGPDRLPGGLLGNGDLVQTTNGPVWVPHGSPMPANALEMRARDDGRVIDLGQPQSNPGTNLYQYREGQRLNPIEQTPPTPAPFDFDHTWDPIQGPVPIVGGYNGFPPAPTPALTTPPPLGTGGTDPANPGLGSGLTPPTPLPGMPNPPAPGGPPGGGQQLDQVLASYGLMRGPNGEILPVMLRQGMNPHQLAPTPQGGGYGLLGAPEMLGQRGLL